MVKLPKGLCTIVDNRIVLTTPKIQYVLYSEYLNGIIAETDSATINFILNSTSKKVNANSVSFRNGNQVLHLDLMQKANVDLRCINREYDFKFEFKRLRQFKFKFDLIEFIDDIVLVRSDTFVFCCINESKLPKFKMPYSELSRLDSTVGLGLGLDAVTVYADNFCATVPRVFKKLNPLPKDLFDTDYEFEEFDFSAILKFKTGDIVEFRSNGAFTENFEIQEKVPACLIGLNFIKNDLMHIPRKSKISSNEFGLVFITTTEKEFGIISKTSELKKRRVINE